MQLFLFLAADSLTRRAIEVSSPTTSHSNYRGRFAPSPSGPLHFGSLIAALGSYLQAKSQKGKWLVRIEDIDPPREIDGAAESILNTLKAHGLVWDEPVQYQSQNAHAHDLALSQLFTSGRGYFCECTRKIIQQQGGYYLQTCRDKNLSAGGCSMRFRNQNPILDFNDGLLGTVEIENKVATEDFIIKRKDGLYAYHLAVVVDDIQQNVTEIVRGADLLLPTACQLSLYQAFDKTPPNYIHLPVAVTSPGMKLSKQNHAPALENNNAIENLHQALQFLHQPLQSLNKYQTVEDILNWAISHWDLTLVPNKREIGVNPL